MNTSDPAAGVSVEAMFLLAALAKRCPLEVRDGRLIVVIDTPRELVEMVAEPEDLDQLEAAKLVVIGATGAVPTTRGEFLGRQWLKNVVRTRRVE